MNKHLGTYLTQTIYRIQETEEWRYKISLNYPKTPVQQKNVMGNDKMTAHIYFIKVGNKSVL